MAVQIVYDALTASMDYGSGFLDWEEVAAIKALAQAGGFEQPEYQVDFCEACHHDLEFHRGRGWSPSGGPVYSAQPCRQRRVIREATMKSRAEWGICGCEDGGPDIRPRHARASSPHTPLAQHDAQGD